MQSLWLPLAGLVFGFALLVWAAGRFVEGAAAIARNLGVSPLVVGLIIVGFGTSAPEMLISAIAAWDGRPGIGIGNAVGSNIANIALVLGTTALVRPLTVHSGLLRKELPILLVAILFALVLLLNGSLGRWNGLLLLASIGILVYWTLSLAWRTRNHAAADPMAAEYAAEMPPVMSTGRALFWLIVGLILLLISSHILVWAAVQVAQAWGMSDLVIGLTIVAIGTSLPELAASISAALKGEYDIAIGNVVGSNTFNILAVMGIAGVIQPGPFAPEVLTRDFPVMIGLTLALFTMAYGFRGEGRINRVEGALLLAAFAGYLSLLYVQA